MTSNKETTNSFGYLLTFHFFQNGGRVFWLCVTAGIFLATCTVLIFDAVDAKQWRNIFVTLPILFSFGVSIFSMGLVRLMHVIAGKKFKPMNLERIKLWNSFGLVEKFQVYFLTLVLLLLSTGMGWVMGGLVLLFWRK